MENKRIQIGRYRPFRDPYLAAVVVRLQWAYGIDDGRVKEHLNGGERLKPRFAEHVVNVCHNRQVALDSQVQGRAGAMLPVLSRRLFDRMPHQYLLKPLTMRDIEKAGLKGVVPLL